MRTKNTTTKIEHIAIIKPNASNKRSVSYLDKFPREYSSNLVFFESLTSLTENAEIIKKLRMIDSKNAKFCHKST